MESVDCQELKQHIYILIDYLQSRDYSIRKLSKILFNNSIFKVQSWSGFKEKVKELSLVDSESFLENIKKILDEEYKRSLFFGKKVIVFYDLQGFSEQQFNDLEMRIEGEIENNIEIIDFNSMNIAWIIIAYFFELCDVGVDEIC